MAQILKKNKSWMARVSWYEYDQGVKKRKFKNKSGFKTKKEAQIWANKYEVDKEITIKLQIKILHLPTTL